MRKKKSKKALKAMKAATQKATKRKAPVVKKKSLVPDLVDGKFYIDSGVGEFLICDGSFGSIESAFVPVIFSSKDDAGKALRALNEKSPLSSPATVKPLKNLMATNFEVNPDGKITVEATFKDSAATFREAIRDVRTMYKSDLVAAVKLVSELQRKRKLFDKAVAKYGV